MTYKNLINKTNLIVIIILLIGTILRFYKLDWGEGYFFHPDEWNIVSFSRNVNPNFNNLDSFTKGVFAYGSFLPYFIHFLIKSPGFDGFSDYVLTFRILSALLSTLTIYISYLIGNLIKSAKAGVIAALLTAFSPGLIQAAHFGTFESYLIFLLSLAVLFSILSLEKLQWLSLSSAFLAITLAAAAKINSLVLGFVPFTASFYLAVKKTIFKNIFLSVLLFQIAVLLSAIISPYYLTDNFRQMFAYERNLVFGKTIVFYTQQFVEKPPLIFTLQSIYPYITNPLLLLISPIALASVIRPSIGNFNLKNKFLFSSLIVLLSLTISLLTFSLSFTKWTRFLLPSVLPLSIFLSLWLSEYVSTPKRLAVSLTLASSILQGLCFFRIYLQPDTRLLSSKWICQNIFENSRIITETGNFFDLPINCQKQYQITNFDFYNPDWEKLAQTLEKSDYIFIPSRRVYKNYHYPYYTNLFNGALGFVKIKEFQVLDDEDAEETFSVFDHPRIRIFKKARQLNYREYLKLIETSPS